MSYENPFNALIESAKTALEAMVEQYKEMFEDAQGSPRLTKMQQRQEYQQYLGLPPELQPVVLGRMIEAGIDPEKWVADRQRLMEA